MNFLHPTRRFAPELHKAVFERGAQLGRGYAFYPAKCGEGPDAIPAVQVRIFEERKGTFFEATTPFLCRGRIIDNQADFYDMEFEQPIEAAEIGAVHQPIPPPKTRPDPPRPKRR